MHLNLQTCVSLTIVAIHFSNSTFRFAIKRYDYMLVIILTNMIRILTKPLYFLSFLWYTFYEVNAMAVKCKLSTLMGKNRMSIQDVCNQTGLARNTVSFLYHEKNNTIKFETLNKLCNLFKCNIQDIIEYEEEEQV